MRNLRYVIRLSAAFLSRFKVLIAIGIGLGFLIFFLITFIYPKLYGGQLTKVAVTGRYNINSLPLDIQHKISTGLTKSDASGNIVPNLASSWSTPDKGKTWSFVIKNGLEWQNGDPLKSSDLVYEFSDATVNYPDDKTITFTLQNPYSAFPSVVTRPLFKGGLLGVGEWEVKKLVMAGDFVNQLTLQNNKKDKILYKFYPTEENAKLAYELGEVDEVSRLLDPSPLNTWPRIKIKETTEKGEYVAVFFNTADKLLGDKSLRQALSYATIKDNLNGERVISPIPEGSWAFNPQVKPYNYDKAKAKSMIEAMSSEVKSNLNITLTTSPLLLPKAELIQKDWEEVGVKTNLQVISNIPSEYQAMLAIFDVPEDPDQYTIWHSTQKETNITQYSNPRIDKLLEDGRTLMEPAQRKQAYFDFQRFLLEDSPAIFLYYPKTYTVYR